MRELATTSAAPALTQPRVLLVEDQALIAMEFEALLADQGCSVVGPFASVDTAMDAAMRAPLDGAVLDVHLVDEPSFPLAFMLRSRGVPFIFVTGLSRSVLPAELRETPILTKPVRPHAFGALVRSMLTRAAPIRQ